MKRVIDYLFITVIICSLCRKCADIAAADVEDRAMVMVIVAIGMLYVVVSVRRTADGCVDALFTDIIQQLATTH